MSHYFDVLGTKKQCAFLPTSKEHGLTSPLSTGIRKGSFSEQNFADLVLLVTVEVLRMRRV